MAETGPFALEIEEEPESQLGVMVVFSYKLIQSLYKKHITSYVVRAAGIGEGGSSRERRNLIASVFA